MLTAGELIEEGATLRRMQNKLVGDGMLWIIRNDLAELAARVEQAAGARAVQELLAQSMGNAA